MLICTSRMKVHSIYHMLEIFIGVLRCVVPRPCGSCLSARVERAADRPFWAWSGFLRHVGAIAGGCCE